MNLGFHLICDDVRQRGLSKTRRSEEEHVIEGLVTMPGGVDEHTEVCGETSLADKLLETARAKGLLIRMFTRTGIGGEDFVGHITTLPYRPHPPNRWRLEA